MTVDSEDALDRSSLDVQRLGKLCQHDVEAACITPGQQFAHDVARARSGSDHKDHFVPGRPERLDGVVLARLVWITKEPLHTLSL